MRKKDDLQAAGPPAATPSGAALIPSGQASGHEWSLVEPAGHDASELNESTTQAARDLLDEGSSDNTQASYASAMRYWQAWYALRRPSALAEAAGRGGKAWEAEKLALPVPYAVVVTFIADHAQRTRKRGSGRAGDADGLTCEMPAEVERALLASGAKGKPGPMKLGTLLHRVTVLSKAHRITGQLNPCKDQRVVQLLTKTRTAYAKRGQAAPKKQQALTADKLAQLLDTCDDSLQGVRDRALLAFAWATGGRRRSEVSSALVENLQAEPGGNYSYLLGFSKSNQTGEERVDNRKPLVGPAAAALRAWLAVSKVTSGPIFRRVRGEKVGPPLTGETVRNIVKERCKLVPGLDPAEFSAHSLRSGFVTEAGRQKVPVPEAMAMTGHSSMDTFMGYYRAAELQQSAAANMLGNALAAADKPKDGAA